MIETFRISVIYFLAVLTAGFALGTVRVLWLVEALGERYAELIEMPFMAIVCGVVARYLTAKYNHKLTPKRAVGIGLVGLALLVAIEFSVVLSLRGLSLSEYLASRDVIAGFAYLLGLAWYAVAPWFFYHQSNKS